MNRLSLGAVLVGCLTSALALAAQAQTVNTETQRDINQQTRIEQGLKSGQLSTREAARMEAGQSRIEKAESRALKDGELSATEKNRIRAMQDRNSKAIYAQKHNGSMGDPQSASSQRLQHDVQRDVNQQTRIKQGLKSGQLTTQEAGQLQRGEAHASSAEARAGRDGQVSVHEQARVRADLDRQSRKVRRQKHDGQTQS